MTPCLSCSAPIEVSGGDMVWCVACRDVDRDGDRVRVIHGDSVTAMRALYKAGHRFALAYLDPPFFTQQAWKMPDGEVAFRDDEWDTLDDYVAAICDLVHGAYDLLIPEGSIVVHIDPTTSHYLKCAFDDAFGDPAFASEIIWRYRRWPTPTKNFQAMHDVLLRYVKDPTIDPRWNQLYEPLSPKTTDQWKGLKQRAVMADGKKGKAQRVRSSVDQEESPGAPMSDVWELGIIGPASDERTGYPTQKPEALLERLILALTNEGDAVLDPTCGSGTTLAVAHRLGRRAIGIDASAVAVRVARERLAPMLAQRSLFDEALP